MEKIIQYMADFIINNKKVEGIEVILQWVISGLSDPPETQVLAVPKNLLTPLT